MIYEVFGSGEEVVKLSTVCDLWNLSQSYVFMWDAHRYDMLRLGMFTGTRYFPSEGGDKCAPTPTGNHLEAATRPLPPPPPTRNNLSPVIRPATANTNNALLQTSERPTVTVMVCELIFSTFSSF